MSENLSPVFHVIVSTDVAEDLRKWKDLCIQKYGYRGGIKRRFQEIVMEDLRKLEINNGS